MEKESTLKNINREIKSYINESNFVSIKCRNKLIKLLANEFEIDLPIENYASIDIELTATGDITMRGDTYKNSKKLTIDEIEEHYNKFKIQADSMLKHKNVNSYNKNNFNNVGNILLLGLFLIIFIIIAIDSIISLLNGNFFHLINVAIFVSVWFMPAIHIQERIEQAKNFIKRKFKK